MKKNAFLALEDGSCFYGHSQCSDGFSCAEVIFNTAPFGYQEVCTDPSYANQFVVFTSCHIGNVGVNVEDYESENIWVKGVIAREISKYTSSWRAQCSYIDFLKENKTPWIEGIDTRKLTRHLQKTGSQNGCLVIGEVSPLFGIAKAREHVKAEGLDLLQVVLEKKRYNFDSRNIHMNESIKPLICVLDFGIKNSIVKRLKKENCAIKIFPGEYCYRNHP